MANAIRHASQLARARARNIGESHEIDRNERFPVGTVPPWVVTCLLEVRWKIYEESDLRGEATGPRALNAWRWERWRWRARVQAWRREKRQRTRGTQNSPRAVAGTRRDDGIFITTRFAPGIILGTFSRELSAEKARAPTRPRLCESTRESYCRKWIHASTSRTFGILFSCRTERWFANVENMLWKLAYGGVLLSVTYRRKQPRVRVTCLQSHSASFSYRW